MTISITKVAGYRANVTFESANGLQFQKAFITTNNSFRIGDSSFTLTGDGVAKIKSIVTDPTTGMQSANTATVKRQS
jgi:hypothetical protein